MPLNLIRRHQHSSFTSPPILVMSVFCTEAVAQFSLTQTPTRRHRKTSRVHFLDFPTRKSVDVSSREQTSHWRSRIDAAMRRQGRGG